MTSRPIEAIAIGASAGAIDALSTILPALPKNYPLPLMIVVHLPVDKNSLIVELFRRKCLIDVYEAEDKAPIQGGAAYFAPPDYHLLVEPHRHFALSSEEPVQYSRPSIDLLFESAADAYAEHLLAVVLTGANRDGSHGLRCICDAGGQAIVQNPSTAYASAMPLAAAEACPEASRMTLEQIAAFLKAAVKSHE